MFERVEERPRARLDARVCGAADATGRGRTGGGGNRWALLSVPYANQ